MMLARASAVIACAAVMAHLLVACGRTDRRAGDRDQQGRPIEDVSSVRPNPEALRQDPSAVAVQRLRRVESVGDCAPRYKTGELGMCVNNKPCRGFGVIDDVGVVSCTCYGKTGGCAENERCDYRKVVCVPDDDPLPGRSRAR